MDRLHKRRRELIEELEGVERSRRGQLSEQYIEKPGADGKLKRYGPDNLGIGDINYWVVEGGVGAVGRFTRNGGSGIRARRIGSADA